MSETTHDRIAVSLERLGEKEPELVGEFVELMASADATAMVGLFGGEHVEIVSADKSQTGKPASSTTVSVLSGVEWAYGPDETPLPPTRIQPPLPADETPPAALHLNRVQVDEPEHYVHGGRALVRLLRNLVDSDDRTRDGDLLPHRQYHQYGGWYLNDEQLEGTLVLGHDKNVRLVVLAGGQLDHSLVGWCSTIIFRNREFFSCGTDTPFLSQQLHATVNPRRWLWTRIEAIAWVP